MKPLHAFLVLLLAFACKKGPDEAHRRDREEAQAAAVRFTGEVMSCRGADDSRSCRDGCNTCTPEPWVCGGGGTLVICPRNAGLSCTVETPTIRQPVEAAP